MKLQGYFKEIPTDPNTVDQAAEQMASPTDEVRGVIFGGGEGGSFTSNLLNSGGQWLKTLGQILEPLDETGSSPSINLLTAEEANAKYGIPGELNFNHSGIIDEQTAAWKNRNKREELYRRDVLARNETVGGLEGFGLSVAGGIVDPASMAANFIPVVGEGKIAGNIAGAGLKTRVMSGALRGARAGAQGGVIVEGATYGMAQYQGKDYQPQDAAAGILASTIFGAGLGGISAVPRPRSHAMVDRLQAAGLPPHIAEGVAAGIHAESGMNPNAVNPTSGAYGIGQWLGPRKKALFARYGDKPTLDQQIEFLAWELNGGDHGGAAVLRAGDSASALEAYIRDFMRPAPGRETDGDLARGTAWLGGERPAAAQDVAPALDMPSEALPPLVSAMDEIDRAGAVAKAIDDMVHDGQVDIGVMVERAAEAPRARADLDDVDATLKVPHRIFEDGVAVTREGREIPVRFAVVEARDLVQSHDADLMRNPAYPQDLQPRNRDAAGAQADLLETETRFNPKLLMRDVSASGGAPIIAPDGVVESGNGRVIILQRNYERGTDLAKRYREELQAQGYDTTGMEAPVLVRARTQTLTGPERVRLSRELNGEATARMSLTEQAFVDDEALDDAAMALYQGGAVNSAGNARFVRAVVDRIGGGRMGEMIDARTGSLSATGHERIQAALVAKAYGDRGLVRAIFDTANPTLKVFGEALTEAAPSWGKMRAMAARGELAAGADTTPYLVEALAFVRHVRDNRLNMADLVEKWADQTDMFARDALSPQGLEYLRLMFRDDTFKSQRKAADIAADLQDIAAAAMDSQAGPDLFGAVQDFDVKAQVDVLRARAAREGRNDGELFGERNAGYGGGPDADRAAPGVIVEQRPAVEGRDGGGDAAAQGGGPTGPRDAAVKFSDPEILELMAEVEALRADVLGVEVAAFDDPQHLARAIDAFGNCLIFEGGE